MSEYFQKSYDAIADEMQTGLGVGIQSYGARGVELPIFVQDLASARLVV